MNGKKITQIKKDSGESYRINLDALSLEQLQDVSDYHWSYSTPASMSVLIRRAVRFYSDHLRGLSSDEDRNREATELYRAAKGC